ncbi:MAG: hypothetical protein WB998_11010 [Solirubrobacteraceae bacterium]
MCSLPRDAHMVAADAQAQLYVRPERSGPRGELLWPEAFGCVFGHRRTYSLGEISLGGTPEGGKGIELETLGGSFVAYEYTLFSQGFKESLVIVRSLLNGHIIHRVPSGPSRLPKSVGAGPLTTLVVKGDGAVAWIVESGREEASAANHFVSHSEYTIFALDKTGTRQLAAGKNIDPYSLGLVGSTLYWTQGVEPGSAVLN